MVCCLQKVFIKIDIFIEGTIECCFVEILCKGKNNEPKEKTKSGTIQDGASIKKDRSNCQKDIRTAVPPGAGEARGTPL